MCLILAGVFNFKSRDMRLVSPWKLDHRYGDKQGIIGIKTRKPDTKIYASLSLLEIL